MQNHEITKEHILKWKIEINNCMSNNDFEKAFFMFIMRITRLNESQKNEFIEYFKNIFKEAVNI